MEETVKPQESAPQAREHAPLTHKKSFFKQKGVIIGLGSLVVILLAAVAFFFIPAKSASNQDELNTTTSEVVQTLTADQLGLTISVKSDKKAVKFKIDKASDIKSIDYELSYEANNTPEGLAEGGDAKVNRGVQGQVDIKSSPYESEWLELGSCSRNVCKYDAGVEKVNLTLKIIKKSNKVYEATKSQSLK